MKKTKSIMEVVAVFLMMKLFSMWFDSALARGGVASGWRTFLFGIQAIVIPIAIVWLARRNWSAYGFSSANKKLMIHHGFVGAALMMFLGLGLGYLKSRNISTSGMNGSVILSFIAVIMVFLFLLITRRPEGEVRATGKRSVRVAYQLIILTAMVCSPVVVAVVRGGNVPSIMAWDLYFLIMVGFGEEIKYRGYFQSRINAEYGRPWKVFGVSFGPGLLVVSLLFGLSHIVQFGVFNPFLGKYAISPWMLLQAFWGGLFFGLIREKSGNIVASGLAHGVPNAFGQVLFMALK